MSPVLAEPKNTVREIDRISFLTYNYRNHNNWINWASFVLLNGPSRQNSIRYSPHLHLQPTVTRWDYTFHRQPASHPSIHGHDDYSSSLLSCAQTLSSPCGMYLGLCISGVCWKFIISKWLPRPSHPYVRHDKDRIKEYSSTVLQGGPPPYYAQYERRHTYSLIIHIAFLALLAGGRASLSLPALSSSLLFPLIRNPGAITALPPPKSFYEANDLPSHSPAFVARQSS